MVDDIVIYVADFCPYCDRAKRLLDAKGVNYKTIDITEDDNIREEMIEKSSGRKTVPQIFIGKRHVGGFDDLSLLDKQGDLDKLIFE